MKAGEALIAGINDTESQDEDKKAASGREENDW